MQLIIYIVFIIFFSLNIQLACNQGGAESKKPVVVMELDKVEILANIIQMQKISDIPEPDGYERVQVKDLSFAKYLRNLALNTEDNTVYSYDGSVIMGKDGYQYAVIDMDIGKRDLQQCADAVMRLRAEYLYHQKKYAEIHFNFLSDGKPRYYTNYAKEDRNYPKFRKYMNYIFAYANTGSLKNELKKVNKIEDIQIGDIFIQTGVPFGHAVIVVDVAKERQTGKKIFMVAQSFMPAQSIHIIKNVNSDLNPWYSVDFGKTLVLPSWTFYPSDLRRF
ncbi:MAG: hypothetical protein DRJ07_15730 [Bacteroidetes bacterium]|nr:MAG: hypothetical protein DRJ07_15730 [Bacteroidota bacterium]